MPLHASHNNVWPTTEVHPATRSVQIACEQWDHKYINSTNSTRFASLFCDEWFMKKIILQVGERTETSKMLEMSKRGWGQINRIVLWSVFQYWGSPLVPMGALVWSIFFKIYFYEVCIAALTFILWEERKLDCVVVGYKILSGEMEFTFAFCLVKHQYGKNHFHFQFEKHQYGKIHFHFLFGKKSVRQGSSWLSWQRPCSIHIPEDKTF